MSADFSDKGINTRAIHAGEGKQAGSASSAPDLVMSSTFHVDREVSFSANRVGEDVALYGIGVGAERVRGVIEQNRVFDIMMAAYGWHTD
jgi:alkaline phosphatase